MGVDPHAVAATVAVNPFVWGLGAVFVVAAVANWRAVDAPADRLDRRTIAVSKIVATAALLALAALAGDMDGAARLALVIAVVCCLAGDVFLLGTGAGAFVAGLGSFACGHLAYVVTALLIGVSFPRLLIAVPFLVALFGFRFVTQTVPGARRHGGVVLHGAVVFYAVVIAAMVLTATGTPSWAAAAGAMTFAVSDWMIGYDRFVRPFRHARLAVMMTYHVGQILLIGGLISAG